MIEDLTPYVRAEQAGFGGRTALRVRRSRPRHPAAAHPSVPQAGHLALHLGRRGPADRPDDPRRNEVVLPLRPFGPSHREAAPRGHGRSRGGHGHHGGNALHLGRRDAPRADHDDAPDASGQGGESGLGRPHLGPPGPAPRGTDGTRPVHVAAGDRQAIFRDHDRSGGRPPPNSSMRTARSPGLRSA
jgi:hypothetical protein